MRPSTQSNAVNGPNPGVSLEQRQLLEDARRAAIHQNQTRRQCRGLTLAQVQRAMAEPAPGLVDAAGTLAGFGADSSTVQALMAGMRRLGGKPRASASQPSPPGGGGGPTYTGSINTQVPADWGGASPDFTGLDRASGQVRTNDGQVDTFQQLRVPRGPLPSTHSIANRPSSLFENLTIPTEVQWELVNYRTLATDVRSLFNKDSNWSGLWHDSNALRQFAGHPTFDGRPASDHAHRSGVPHGYKEITVYGDRDQRAAWEWWKDLPQVTHTEIWTQDSEIGGPGSGDGDTAPGAPTTKTPDTDPPPDPEPPWDPDHPWAVWASQWAEVGEGWKTVEGDGTVPEMLAWFWTVESSSGGREFQTEETFREFVQQMVLAVCCGQTPSRLDGEIFWDEEWSPVNAASNPNGLGCLPRARCSITPCGRSPYI